MAQKFDEPRTSVTSLVRKPAFAPVSPTTETPATNDPVETGNVEQLVVPYVAEINPNEKISASLVDDIKTLLQLPLPGAIFFDPSPTGRRLQRLFRDNADLFGVEVIHLKGYPGAKADAAFEQDFWNTATVSYVELVADIVDDDRLQSMRRQQAGERRKDVKREATLDKPRVKHFSDFDPLTEEVEVENEPD